MRINLIKKIGILLLIAVIVLQIIWLISMYRSYMVEYKRTADQCLLQAIDIELATRQFSVKKMWYWFDPNKGDSSSILTRKIQTEDTTFSIKINRHEPTSLSKATQSLLHGFKPVNISQLDSIFEQQLIQSLFPVKETYIDYIDLKKNKLINSNAPNEKPFGFYESSTIPIDALDSLGVKAYVKTSYFSILEKMALQLFLSMLLITGALFCLIKLLRTVIEQHEAKKQTVDFMHSMAHEILRPVSSSLLLLERTADKLAMNRTDKLEEHINNARLQLDELAAYTRKIETIVMGEGRVITFNKVHLALGPFLEALKERYEQNQDKTVTVTIRMSEDISLYTDNEYFGKVLENLMENSVKYSGESVHIQITATREKKLVVLSVKDNGRGIAPDDLEYVFDKFYRSKTKPKEKGSGLGLSYVKSIIESLGGKVSVRSEKGAFTEFILEMKNEE